MLRPTKSSTEIPCWPGCRQPATRTRYARRGSPCAKPARLREPCSCPRRRSDGMSIRLPAVRKAVKCVTCPHGEASNMAPLPPPPLACRSPKAWCSSDRRTSSSRSEEHTSELQSQFHLVCRLLLEKKKH